MAPASEIAVQASCFVEYASQPVSALGDVDAVDHRDAEAGEQRRDRQRRTGRRRRRRRAARSAGRRRARRVRRRSRGSIGSITPSAPSCTRVSDAPLIATANSSSQNSRLRCVCGIRMRLSALMTLVSAVTSVLIPHLLRVPAWAGEWAAASRRWRSRRRRPAGGRRSPSASESERAVIVRSTESRWYGGRFASRMSVSRAGVDSVIGPMFCCTPWKITTLSSSAPTK